MELTGVPIDHEPWAMLEGGDPVSESVQAFPGGSRPVSELGGFAKPSPLTVARPWSDLLIVAYKTVFPKVGSLEGKVSYQLTNANKEPIGPVISYTGIVTSSTRPNYQAGKSEEAKWSLILGLNGEIA